MTTLRNPFVLAFSLALMSLPLTAVAQDEPAEQPAAEPAEPAEAIPTAEEIFEAYIEAIGGHDAIRAQTHRLLTGIYRGAPFRSGARISLWQQAPSSSHLRLAEPLGIHYDIYCDGQTVWERGNDDVAKQLVGDDRIEMMETSDFLGESNYAERYEEIQVTGSGSVMDEPVWAVQVRSVDGRERTLMFSKESKLFVAEQSTIGAGGDSPMSIQVVLDEYKDVGGVLFPMRQRQEIIGTNRKIEIVYREGSVEEFEHDFSPPSDMIPAAEEEAVPEEADPEEDG